MSQELANIALPDMGSTINSVYTTISSQLENMITLHTRKGDTDIVQRLQALNTVVDSNFGLLVDVGNECVEIFDKMVETAKDCEAYKEMYHKEHRTRQIEADKIVEIVAAHEKTLQYNGELTKSNQALQIKLGEMHRVKKQLSARDETIEANKKTITGLEQALQQAKSKVHSALTTCKAGIELMKYIREVMIFEGLAVRETAIVDNQHYYIYARPGLPTDWDGVAGEVLSAGHKYYLRVETNSGYHYDVLPKLDGGIHVCKPKALPASVKKHLQEIYAEGTEFNVSNLDMRTDKLNTLIKQLGATLLDHEVYLQQALKSSAPVIKKNNKR